MRGRLVLALVILVPVALAGGGTRAAPATALQSGRIVFWSSLGGIYAVNPDGTGLTLLTRDARDDSPRPSPDGRLIEYRRLGGDFAVMNADGSGRRPVRGCKDHPWWSPDSTRLVCETDSEGGLGIADVASGAVTPLTRAGKTPVWSPDGRSIAFVDDGLWVVPAEGGKRQRLGTRRVDEFDGLTWSPDSGRIAYEGAAGRRGHPNDLDLFTIRRDGTGERRVATRVELGSPEWSPDGSWIAFGAPVRRDIGETVWLVRPDGSGLRRLVKSGDEAASDASWSPDGSALVYEQQRYSETLDYDLFVISPRGGRGRAVTGPFPEGGSNQLPRWTPGPPLTTAPRQRPRTLPLRHARTLSSAGAVAADGARGAIADEPCGIRVWEPLAHRSLRMRRLCRNSDNPPGISQLVLAGRRLAWISSASSTEELVTELGTARIGARRPTFVTAEVSSSDTFRDGSEIHALQGAGSTIAFTSSRYDHKKEARSAWLLLTRRGRRCPATEYMKPKALCRRLPGGGLTAAVDAGRVLAVAQGGAVRLLTPSGKVLRRWGLGAGIDEARLQGHTLAVQRGVSLALYDTRSGAKTATRPLAPNEGARPRLLDVQGNVAVYVTGGAVHVLRLSDGRDLALALPRAAPPFDAQLASSGLYVTWNQMHTRRYGRFTFVPLRALG
jgi:Tol biopolymer transport system component